MQDETAGGRWQAAFTVEQDVHRRAAGDPGAVVGVDLGIRVLAVLSTGEVVANPKPLARAQRHYADCPGGPRDAGVLTGVPGRRHRGAGSVPQPWWRRRTDGSRTSGGTPSTS